MSDRASCSVISEDAATCVFFSLGPPTSSFIRTSEGFLGEWVSSGTCPQSFNISDTNVHQRNSCSAAQYTQMAFFTFYISPGANILWSTDQVFDLGLNLGNCSGWLGGIEVETGWQEVQWVTVSVCVCVRERERERDTQGHVWTVSPHWYAA